MAVSTFTWLDHRDDDSQRVREALAAFDERGMIDPLGFGPVRDALSDILFPGISTIQTRARYFLMVPWIYWSLDADGIRPDAGAQVVHERELALVESLLRGSADHNGIIGRVSRQALKQVPSFIYWGGLGTWGIRQFDGTRYDYIASLDARRQAHARADDIDGSSQTGNPWHPGLPPAPTDLLDAATLDLTRDEALFLQGRVLDTVPDSFLAVLVRDGTTDLDAADPWEHPLAATAPPRIRRHLHHAGLFSLATWGAALVYNDELSDLLETDGGERLPVDYAADIEDWHAEVAGRGDELGAWDRADFWRLIRTQNPHVAAPVRLFVDWCLDRALADPATISTDPHVREELRRREAALKGPRAKLANRRAREQAPSAQGDEQLRFRWRQARRIVADINRGLATDA
jgi:Family of unknown function (DUF6361)